MSPIRLIECAILVTYVPQGQDSRMTRAKNRHQAGASSCPRSLEEQAMMAIRRWWVACLTAAVVIVGVGAPAQSADQVGGQPFTQDRLDQLVAPIALYPDSLVAQILMASTYPLEIVEAARWVDRNPGLKDEKLENALASEDWDPSVKALTNFPDVLKRMSDNLDWTQDLGDAVLAQQGDVMNAIQRMRRYAQDAGNLKTTREQKVVVQEKVIVIEPASEVVYVPAYNPTLVYGTYWEPPSYYYPIYTHPPGYWYPPGYVASNIISFGLGMAVGAAIWNNWNWGHCDWRGGSVTINNNFNFSRNINTGNINIGNKVGGGRYSNWEHSVGHRRGVRYGDTATQQKFAGQLGNRANRTGIDRDTARGFDRAAKGGEGRPATRETRAERPTTRDLESSLGKARDRAATGDRPRAETRDRPAQRDVAKDRAKPDTRDRSASSRDTPGRAATRDRARSTGETARLADRSGGGKTSAFQPQGRGGSERAASARGGQSRAASRAGGGGGARQGGARGGGGLRQ